jgi:plasmid stabilization system protein ParE
MNLSRQALEDFRQIYTHEFGERLSESQAQEMAENLLALFELLLGQPAGADDGTSKRHSRSPLPS